MRRAYLDPFLDMYSSEIMSYSFSKKPSAVSIMKALDEAIEASSDCCYRRTFRSDQGWAYELINITISESKKSWIILVLSI